MKNLKVNDLEMWKDAGTNAEKPNYKGTARDFLKKRYNGGFVFGIDNLKNYGIFKIMGWIIDFKPVMKKFIVKQYGNLYEAFAFNKTDLKNSILGKIEYIKEI